MDGQPTFSLARSVIPLRISLLWTTLLPKWKLQGGIRRTFQVHKAASHVLCRLEGIREYILNFFRGELLVDAASKVSPGERGLRELARRLRPRGRLQTALVRLPLRSSWSAEQEQFQMVRRSRIGVRRASPRNQGKFCTVLLLTTPVCPRLQHSRNLGPAF